MWIETEVFVLATIADISDEEVVITFGSTA